MTVYRSPYASGTKPTPFTYEAEANVLRAEVTLPAATQLAIGDELHFFPLPAGLVVRDWWIDTDDLDSGGTPTLAMDLGVLAGSAPGSLAASTAAADGGKWLTASTFAQSAAVQRNSAGTAAIQTALARMSTSATDRMVGLKVTAAAAGAIAAQSVIGITVILGVPA